MTGVLASAPFFRWDWVGRNLDTIGRRTLEHLQLTGLSLGLGFVTALVLAVIARRFRWTYGPLSSLAGLLYTIPSLAAFLVLARVVGLTTVWTPVLALASYSLLILLRSIVVGLDAVPADVRDAANGMGFTPIQRFLHVDLPLAAPYVLAGLRLATITVLSLVTVTAVIGRGGLGYFMLDGIRRSIPFPTEIIVASVLVMALSVTSDYLLHRLERRLQAWNRR